MRVAGLAAAASLFATMALSIQRYCGHRKRDRRGSSGPPRNAYIFNTLLFLIGGFLVMFMAAGFAMLEAGLVRSKNVSMQCLKNIALYSIAGIMYWVRWLQPDVSRRRWRFHRHLQLIAGSEPWVRR